MSERLTTIRLYGKLGTKFGRRHRLAVGSAAEAVRALAALYPGFEAHLTRSKSEGVGYSVFLGKTNIGEEQLHNPAGEQEIRIAPILLGSKRGGIFQIVLGAALFAVAAIATGGVSIAAMGGLWGTVATIGVQMMIGGVMQMLAPQPKGLGAQDSPNNRANHSFNGPVNTQAQGNPVPVLYGHLIVGSAVISASISNEDFYAPKLPPCPEGTTPDKMIWWRAIDTVMNDGEKTYECLLEPEESGSGPNGSIEGAAGGGSPTWIKSSIGELTQE